MRDLWARVADISRREHGRALKSVETACEVWIDGGIPFQVRTLVGSHPKAEAGREQQRTGRNPFLPPEPELLVGELSSTHVAVLNKFNVFGHHLLVVTRAFVPQEGLLTLEDFQALSLAMEGIDALAFYNSGAIAGASQAHRHLQVAPLPLIPATGGWPTPIDAAFSGTAELPFDAVLRRLPGSALGGDHAEELEQLYRAMMGEAGLADGGGPYNLLLTRRWMMIVPRCRDRVEGISINALGFAGSLLVRDADRLARLKDFGACALLRAVSGLG